MAEPIAFEDLLAHAEWLRRLAAHLQQGDEDAGDVVQETWMAALASPPAADRPPRPWLAEVLRNFVRKTARMARNRRAREALVQRSGEHLAPSPEQLLELAEGHHLLSRLVVSLEEPYRTAIILRYYNGQEPTAIARRLDVPAGTVRWRLSEGRRRLRTAFLAHHGGQRGSWRKALLPVAPLGVGHRHAKGALLIVSTKSKIAGTAALLALALAAGTSPWWGRLAASHRMDGGHATSSAGSAARPGAGASAETPARIDDGVARQMPGANQPGSPRAQPGALGARPREAPPKLLLAPPELSASSLAPPSLKRGSLAKEEIRSAMRSVIPTMKGCYAKLLEEDPHASGRLVVRFTIVEREGAGRISEATVVPRENDGGAPELVSPLAEQCILNAISEVTFSAPAGGPVTVTYPFQFAPHAPAPEGR
jgi:RNA polymerase sigma-70 factor (ECF subfamily)